MRIVTSLQDKLKAFKSRLDDARLSHDDYLNLSNSGITLDTARKNGLYTETDPKKICEILNRRYVYAKGGLMIPYRSLDGEPTGYFSFRPRVPRRDHKTQKEIKYEQPSGKDNRIYFPADSVPLICDTNSPLVIVEGVKKAIALSQIGVAAVSINGVYGWSKGDKQLCDDLTPLVARRDIYLCNDYDKKDKTREYVASAERHFAKALRQARAAEVFRIVLPCGWCGEKQGVDDFLMSFASSEEPDFAKIAFNRLVEIAKPVPRTIASVSQPEGRTDVANAARLINRHGETVRYISPWQSWTIWDGKHWKIDDTLRMESLAKEVAETLWQKLRTEQELRNNEIFRFFTSSSSSTGLRHMIDVARSEVGIALSPDQLDVDGWLLNVSNGTIDLRTGELREHRPRDYLTKISPVVFDARANCPEWERFLRRILKGNNDLIEYVRRLVGYSLTGNTTEHILPFCFGKGANGKSTFLELVFKLLGPDYSMKAPPSLLVAKHAESHPTEIADLFRMRMVACIETEAGKALAESLTKELTGGDRIRARKMHKDFFEFVPTHKIWMAGNYRPSIKGTDNGIWRRLKLIPFDVSIPEAEQDKNLGDKLAAELSGILNWALKGCLDWQRFGMQEPSIVRAATSEYRKNEDELGEFLLEHCEEDPKFIESSTELAKALEACNKKIDKRQLASELERRGYEKTQFTSGPRKGHKAWKGLRLRKQ